MYLNAKGFSHKSLESLRLTLTLDVFKLKRCLRKHMKVERLTLTLDVFKFF